jgi:hypothetical protein
MERLTEEEINKYNFLIFGEPELRSYLAPHGQQIERYCVPVSEHSGNGMKRLLGYLPLPKDYLNAWVQLCYNVVYSKEIFTIHMELLQDSTQLPTRRKYLANAAASAATQLKYYIYCRRKIIEDIQENASHSYSLHVFDEYMIKERFDYHFIPPKKLVKLPYWDADPFDIEDAMGEKKKKMDEFLRKLLISFQMRPSPTSAQK